METFKILRGTQCCDRFAAAIGDGVEAMTQERMEQNIEEHAYRFILYHFAAGCKPAGQLREWMSNSEFTEEKERAMTRVIRLFDTEQEARESV